MDKKNLKTQNIVTSTPSFNSKIEINLPGNEEDIFHKMVERILELISNYQNIGSNWVFVQINQLEIILHSGNLSKDHPRSNFLKSLKIKKRLSTFKIMIMNVLSGV